MTLQERHALTQTELAAAESLAARAEQARNDAVAQQLRLQGRLAVLEELIKEEASHG